MGKIKSTEDSEDLLADLSKLVESWVWMARGEALKRSEFRKDMLLLYKFNDSNILPADCFLYVSRYD
jgi:hypothetical protein